MEDRVWMIYVDTFMGYNECGDPDYNPIPEDILYHTEEEAVKALRRKRVTRKHVQWNLMVGHIDEYGRFVYDGRIMTKDELGICEDKEMYDYETDYQW